MRLTIARARWVAASLRNEPLGFLGPIGSNREQLEQRKGALLPLIDYLRLKYSASSLAMTSSLLDAIAMALSLREEVRE